MISVVDFLRKTPELTVHTMTDFNFKYYHYSVEWKNGKSKGYGSGITPQEAQLKATFEMIERSVFHYFASVDTTSSGWSAHIKLELAQHNAKLELLERDAVLNAWLLQRPPLIRSDLKLQTGLFIQNPILEFGVGDNLSILGLIYESYGKKIFLSCADTSDARCIQKLSADVERAHLILSNPVFNNKILQFHFDSFNQTEPQSLAWLYKNQDPLRYENTEFNYTEFEVPLWDESTSFVVQANSQTLQKLFWGSAGIKNINRKRIQYISKNILNLNKKPHPII